MNWKTAYEETQKADLWGFFDISANFTQDTLNK